MTALAPMLPTIGWWDVLGPLSLWAVFVAAAWVAIYGWVNLFGAMKDEGDE